MHLILTDDKQHLIRFQHYSEISEIEVFKCNPIRKHSRMVGRIVGFSHDSSLMIVWNESYWVYDLTRALLLKIEQVDRADFPPEALLDVRGTGKADLKIQVFDIISGAVRREHYATEEKGVSKGFEDAVKIIASPYVMLKLWYSTDWGEGLEGYIFDLITGKYQIMTHTDIDHYQAAHKMLVLQSFRGATLVEFNEQTIRSTVSPWEGISLREGKISGIATVPTNRNLIVLAQQREISFVNILPPDKMPDDPRQLHHYGTSISTKMTAWNDINALCIDSSGRYLYISYKNGELDVFDMQVKHFSEHYQIPFWQKLFGN